MKTPKPVVVVMGVSASGKSTIGRALAKRLDCPFEEGDDLHPQANIEKMHAGHPLDDSDRAPWLERIASWITRQYRSGAGGVVSCSALKRRYRDRLRRADRHLVFVFPDPDREALQRRFAGRTGHFMPASLLDSQLATLERPGTDERVLRLDGLLTIDEAVDAAATWIASDPVS